MINRLLALLGLGAALAACTGPPAPPPVDAFTNLLNMNSASVPADAPMTLGQPVAFITSENVERYIGHLQDAKAYWASVVPASLTNTVVIADTDPTYFAGQLLKMLRRHYPAIERVHDFREAVAKGNKGVIVVDMKMKWMEPYGDRHNKIDIDAYFFNTAMDPVSKLSGHAEYNVPFASMEGHVQKITDEALGQIDQKMMALIH